MLQHLEITEDVLALGNMMMGRLYLELGQTDEAKHFLERAVLLSAEFEFTDWYISVAHQLIAQMDALYPESVSKY